jgi:hypothetical protein
MKFAVSLGTFDLVNFAKLNLAYLRHVFGDDTPIICYDGKSANSEAMRELAEEYGAAYFTERENRLHFAGCQQNSVTAVKINQRLILLDKSIPDRVREVFSGRVTALAMPGQCSEASIIQEGSKFHSRFKVMPDCIFMRASAFDPVQMSKSYEDQWKSGTRKMDTLTETWWANRVHGEYRDRHVTLPWLTEHTPGQPFLYLRKIQNQPTDFAEAARRIGIPVSGYQTVEWQEMGRGKYRPTPKA